MNKEEIVVMILLPLIREVLANHRSSVRVMHLENMCRLMII